jgi:hypothetical protein
MSARFLVWGLVFACAVIFSGCRKKEEKAKSPKKQHEENLIKVNDEHLAFDSFVHAVKGVFEWYETQLPVTDATRQQTAKALLEKMEKVSVTGLPPGFTRAWQAMVEAWRGLAKSGSLGAELEEAGARAAQELNRLLEERGILELKF